MSIPSLRARWFSLVAGLMIAAGAPTGARQEPLPTASQIVARHVAAMGGERAYRAVRSIHARGKLEIPAQGLGGDLDLQLARPDKLLYRVTVPGIGLIENGYDGKTGWSVSPIVGPELLEGAQLSEAADDAWFDATLHDADHVSAMVTEARETFDGRPAYKVAVTLKSGNRLTEYFDVETGLQIGSEAPRTTPQGVIPTVNILRNYKRFGALQQATTLVQRAIGLEQIVTITACEFDVVPDTAFDPPPAVKALIKR